MNRIGTFIVTRECARLLEISKGSIILLASIRAHRATEHQEAYSASKGGVVSLARSLAASLANRGVRWFVLHDCNRRKLMQRFEVILSRLVKLMVRLHRVFGVS